MKLPFSHLNKEEFLIGTTFGLCFYFKIGLVAIPLALFCGIFWEQGGSILDDGGHNLYRRLGCSAMPCILIYLLQNFNPIALFSVPMAYAVFCFFYPTTSP